MSVMAPTQRLMALDQGNGVRSARSALKARISRLGEHDGQRLVADILAGDLPEALGQMYVFELLMLAPRVGDVKVRQILTRAGVYPLKRAADLTARQRLVLSEKLREMAGFNKASEGNCNV